MSELSGPEARIIVATLTVLGTLGAAWITARAARWARDVNRAAQTVVEQVRPENGGRLGELVEHTARLLEVVDGRLHDVSKRVDAHASELRDIRRHLEGTEAQLIAQGEAISELREDLARKGVSG